MSTTTTFDRGSEWSKDRLYDGWGDCGEGPNGEKCDYKATYEKIGNMVVDEFHRLVQAAGGRATWIPYTSELIGPIDEDIEINYTGLRDEACETIWQEWNDGDIDPVWEDAE